MMNIMLSKIFSRATSSNSKWFSLFLATFLTMMMAGYAGGDATKRTKVVVIGGGLAGMSAAISAVEKGAEVIVIEGEKDVGGNSAKASSGINGCMTEAQRAMNIHDSTDKFFEDTVNSGDHLNNPKLVDILVDRSKDAVQWLTGGLNVPLTDVILCGGHSVARTHWLPSPKEGKPTPVGIAIIRALKSRIEKLKADGHPIDVIYETKAVDLITKKVDTRSDVVGVKVRRGNASEVENLDADRVVLATGGFSNDHEKDSLLEEFAPNVVSFPTTNGPFATGSGVKMGRKLGAHLIDMNKVQLHPTGFIDPKKPTDGTKFLAAEALRGAGGIMVNQKGVRFANELGRRDEVTKLIIENCEIDEKAKAHIAYLIMNDKTIDRFGWPAFNFYWKIKGFFTRYENAADFESKLNMDAKVLSKTMASYNAKAEAAAAGKAVTDDFGKKDFPAMFNPEEPLYVSQVTPSIHYTMGGLEINGRAQVIGNDGFPIEDLYAAGEVSGGLHGENRLCGNSLLECVVFGRIAGEEAAAGKRVTSAKNEL